jgi:selenocysteine lyase/cysteine desulfurase
MKSRRDFIGESVLMAGGLPFLSSFAPLFASALDHKVKQLGDKSPRDAANDEGFWAWIREAYTLSPTIINLNAGGVSPQPKVVQDAHIFNYQLCNQGPSYYMWQILDKGREPLRGKLANLAGCDSEEVAINRNSTEGLNTVIFGLNLKAGDEVVLTKYDYPHMMSAWRQREKRDGIKLSWVDWDFPLENDDAIVKAYSDKITSRTKVVHVTHVINWVGQILPCRAIADMAHSKGCEVIVDGAHSFNQLDFKIPETGADYFATSLHKWLGAPFGSGLLYVKKGKAKTIWPLLGDDKPDSDDIRKFEYLGTRSMASEMAIGNAIDFQAGIGIERKEARLRYLKDYWMSKASGIPKVRFHTSTLPKYSCAIASFSVDGWNGNDICDKLLADKKTFVTPIVYEKLNCVRVSPNIYNSLWELHTLVEGIAEVAKATPPGRKDDRPRAG